MKNTLFATVIILLVFACKNDQKENSDPSGSDQTTTEIIETGKEQPTPENPTDSTVSVTQISRENPRENTNSEEVSYKNREQNNEVESRAKAEMKAKQAAENARLETEKQMKAKADMKAEQAAENAKLEAEKRAKAEQEIEKSKQASTTAPKPTSPPVEKPGPPKNEAPTISAPSAESIIKKVDKNMSAKSTVVTTEMVIHGKRRSRTVTSKGYGQGNSKSFTEYLSPAREKGTKMLKLEDRLWIYSPSTDRTIQLSGHMLKQSVMGSDLSYEDMMDDRTLLDVYDAKVIGEEVFEGRKTWVLELTAKVDDASYEKRKTWIDQARFVPLKEELFAKSGQMLKKTVLSNVKKIQRRWFPTKMNYKDMLKTGKGTDFIFKEIQFDPKIPPHIFSKASLKQ